MSAVADDRAEAALASLEGAGAVREGARAAGFHQLEGGWSRHSFVLSVASEAGAAEFVVRVKPPGALLDSDLAQEYRAYRLLSDHGVRAPAVYSLEANDDNPFGGPFFIMSKAHGAAPNVWRRSEREGLEADWNESGALAEDLISNLVAIHGIPALSVAEVLPARSFAEVVGYWRAVQEEMALVRDPVIDEAYAWLSDHEPAPVEPALVHGDYRIGNCLIAGGHITAILDWELAWFGDPRFDLGYVALEYHAGKFTSAGSGLLNAVADRDWFMDQYETRTKSPVDPAVVRTYSVLGALVLLAILTTGVRVYADGRTEDIRMLWSRFAIPGLRQDITRLLDW